MKIEIDTEAGLLRIDKAGEQSELPLWDRAAFEELSHFWLLHGWNQKYPYTFSWLGRPIIQHPEDLVRLQEVIYSLQPDVIVETGIAHGGSLVFYAGLLKAMGRGRVVGVDVEIRPHNRSAIEGHELFSHIDLIEGDSVAGDTLAKVKALVGDAACVLVILDSDHSRKHVRAELEAYHDLVTPGSWIVATDGIMQWLHDLPRGNPDWREDNPVSAVDDFLQSHSGFEIAPPVWRFNESELQNPITAWPSAWLKRIG